MSESACPLCFTAKSLPYHQDKRRRYRQCPGCQLVFVETQFHLSREAEKAEYDLHQNSPNDAGYRRFLSRLSEPLSQRLPPKQKGLDFGCGPGPTLSIILEEAGHKMKLYDPFYFFDQAMLQQSYDFICATEVIEHLSQPYQVLQQLFSCIKPGGMLALMTKLVRDQVSFRNWHYIQDLTHICFFSQASFEFVAATFQVELEILGTDVILLKKVI